MNLTKKSFIFICLTFLLFYPQVFFAQEGASLSGANKPSNTQQADKSGKPAAQQVGEQLKAGQNVKQVQDKTAPANIPPEQKKKKAHEILSLREKKGGKAEVDVKVKEKQVVQADIKTSTKDGAPIKSNEELYRKNTAKKEPTLQIFGHNIFTGPKSSFTPIEAVPVSKGYLIGPGDEIKVVLWGRMDVSYTLEVDNNGEIVVPKLGPLSVAGLSFDQLEELVKFRLGAMTGVNVNVTMGKLRSILVFVLGEVKHPGIYMVSALATVANALHAAGGLSPLGSLRKVELRRQKKVVAVCDLYDFLLKGDISSDARLMAADVIFVPQTGPMVSISGNVERPAIYELKDDLSIENALNLAGGLQPEAYDQRIQIMRPFEHRVKLILDASYADIYKQKEITLQDGDWIRVSSILPSPVNAVYLYGNVIRPGDYEYRAGYGVLDIVAGLESLAVDSYFDYAVVKRYRFRDMKAEILPFNLGKLLFLKDKTQNIPLEPGDEIYVFNKWMFEDRAYASVSGEVRKPGSYYVEEMRIKDLIFKAGDLAENAYLPRAELIRTDKDRRKQTIYLDLAEAMGGNPQHNIKVQNEDSLVIHSVWEKKWKEFVHIKGEIKKPGQYALTKGMRLSDLIFKAGNFTRGAYLEKGELVRYRIVEGEKVVASLINFDVSLALQKDSAHNLPLQPMDVVQIKQIPGWVEKKKTMTIAGEIGFPGTYQILSHERLSDILKRAGKFTKDSYLRGAFFTRESVREKQKQELNGLLKRLEIDMASLAALENEAFLSEEALRNRAYLMAAQNSLLTKLKEKKPTGRVIISLLPVEKLAGGPNDLLLEAGDRLFIPKNPNTVHVLGAVYHPVTAVYDRERGSVSYYLDKAGGPTGNAQTDQIYIVRIDGSVVSKSGRPDSFEKTLLYPGDSIIVPHQGIRPAYLYTLAETAHTPK